MNIDGKLIANSNARTCLASLAPPEALAALAPGPGHTGAPMAAPANHKASRPRRAPLLGYLLVLWRARRVCARVSVVFALALVTGM